MCTVSNEKCWQEYDYNGESQSLQYIICEIVTVQQADEMRAQYKQTTIIRNSGLYTPLHKHAHGRCICQALLD